MAKVHPRITPALRRFIESQHMFFVATAPLSGEGHVNLSPKGQDSFRVLSPHQVAYLDMTGSGNETAAHITENGRITFLFCAFEGAPNILRLYGTGHIVLPSDPAWESLSAHFTLKLGVRQIITADLHRVQTSCGYGIPFYDYLGERDTMDKWCQNKGEDGLVEYRAQKNARSIDQLPAPLAQS
ncbi:MAG: pyridoxamine 5'-phosphate oxidase family protein [Anaerolineae bacterium]|nr:pyridoxamine 5'-phosphate oxidase family protein [Anaerolineae bacterium]